MPAVIRAIVVALALACASAAMAEPGSVLRLSTELSLPRASDNVPRPTFIRGDTIEGTIDRSLAIAGDAEVRRTGLLLQADTVLFKQVDNTIDADGHVRLAREGDTYIGPHLRYNLDTGDGRFEEGEYRIAKNNGRGKTDLTEFVGRDVVRMFNTTYTTCPVGDSSWVLRAKSMQLDTVEDDGEAENAVVVFKGVPILASPYVFFTVGNARHSGFLTPSLGISSKNGVEFFAPYYVNIAPNRDYTFTPRIVTKRGIELGNEFRYLDPTFKGEIEATYVPEDKLFGKQRWSLHASHDQRFTGAFEGAGAYLNVNRVSDDDYLSDYSRSIVGVINRQLTQEGGVTWAAPWWNSQLRVQRFQVLQDPNAPVPIPYERVPQLNFRTFRFDVSGFDVNLEADATKFAHPTFVQGSRGYLIPTASLPLIGPAWFVTPKASVNMATYSLETARIDPNSPLQQNFSRVIPTASVDSGLIFERPATLLGRDLLQTLEPRLYYVRTSYVRQDAVPLFDTSIADFNFAQLFSENIYIGQDRIADSNQLTAAVSTRYLDPSSGAEMFRATIGQRFYFSDQRVTLTPGTTLNTRRRSDFLLSAAGLLATGLTAEATVQFEGESGRASRSSIGVRWSPSPGKIAALSYRFNRDQLEQYDLAAQWNLSERWIGVGRINYSTFERRLVEALLGAEYRSCCWAMRLVAHKYVTASQATNTAFFFELELNGLGRLGSSPADALRRNIPAYRSIDQSLNRQAVYPGSLQYGFDD